MRKKILLICLQVGLSGAAQATLIDRGGGMIYDDVLDVTWLQDASLAAGSVFDDGISNTDGRMFWGNAVAWADNLIFGGFDDWRLPTMDVNLDSNIVDCRTASETDCRDNELGYMFYQNLMGSYFDDLSGDQDPFTNILSVYWSSTVTRTNPTLISVLCFSNGCQNVAGAFNVQLSAWAVRSGDVPAAVPGPGTLSILGLGLSGLMWSRRTRAHFGSLKGQPS